MKLDQGEQVRVRFLNSWYDGTVLGKEKTRYGIEFLFGNATKQELFERGDIRKLCEADALDFARNWESSNGKFKIDAALKAFKDEEVILVKLDLSEVTVPIKSLSEKDKAYVNRFKQANERAVKSGQIPAVTPMLPELEEFEDGFGGTIAIDVDGSTRTEPLGEVPAFLKEFQQSGCGFTMARERQELVAVIPVGGPDQLILMTAREDNFHNRDQLFQSQAYWVSLKQRKAIGSVALSPEHFIVDYDPRHRHLLTVKRGEHLSEEPSFLTVWKLEPGGTSAEPQVCWKSDVMNWPDHLFCKFVDAETVLVKTDRKIYKAWNFVQKKSTYSIRSASFFDAPGLLTFDRKSLIQPEDGKVSVFDAVTGETRFCLSVADRHCSGANINAQGTRLAALTESHIYVWDLAVPSTEPKIYEAPLIGNPFHSRLEWVDDDLILAESTHSRVLFRLSLELPVWSYQMDSRQYWLNADPLVNQVLNGLFFYVVQPDPFASSIAVGAVNLPGPKVNELTQNIDRPSLDKMKPGVAVKISLGKLSDPASVENWLSTKISENGWVLDPQAEIEIFAEMGVGQTQTETYRQIGLGGAETSVTFTPHYANLIIREGEVVIWQTGTSTGAPPMVIGGNIQQQVSQNQVPQLQFFRTVKIPPRIIDPKYSRGFGVSQLGLRGIEVVSTTPPGREADPSVAEQKMKSDQEEDLKNRRNQSGDEGQASGSDSGDPPGGPPGGNSK